eukprot:3362522-Alexandrium_andersonii.AAC.1
MLRPGFPARWKCEWHHPWLREGCRTLQRFAERSTRPAPAFQVPACVLQDQAAREGQPAAVQGAARASKMHHAVCCHCAS